MKISENLTVEKYVAYLDVLGFTELVKAKSDKLDIYYNTVLDVLNGIEKGVTIDSLLISDSTILSCNQTTEDLRSLIKAIQKIQSDCALQGIWIRGAISIGDIYFNREHKIVVGNGLIKAYILEQQAKYPRVIIDPKIIQKDYETSEIFIHTFNHDFIGPGSMPNKVPLIRNVDDSFKRVENDAFFVAFAEKIAEFEKKNLDIIYAKIKSELYGSHEYYTKYLWLKNYFIESISADAGFYQYATETEKPTYLIEILSKFKAL